MTRLRSERGAQLLEFALVLPVLLLVIGGMIDIGLVLKDYQVVTAAAREGGRLAVTESGTDDAVRARVTAFASNGGLTVAPTTAIDEQNLANPDGSTFRAVSVTVSYQHSYLVLGPLAALVNSSVFPSNVMLSSSFTMRKELAATP